MLTREEFLKNFSLISNSFPKNVAVLYVGHSGNSVGISYLELDRVTSELSRYFSRILGKTSQYIGISFSSYFLLPCLILGLWKSGHCFAGINRAYCREDIEHFLKVLGIEYQISDEKDIPSLGELFSEIAIYCRGFKCQKFYIWRNVHQTKMQLDGLEYICYGIMTSGSTGEPKVVQVPWSCILPNAVELSDMFQVTEVDCIFQASPYSFDPFFIELFMVFLKGCSLLIPSEVIRLNCSDLLKTLFSTYINNEPKQFHEPSVSEPYIFLDIIQVDKKQITVLQMTPSLFRRWTDSEIQNFILSSNSSLRILILGGEKFPKKILKLKCAGNKTRIFNIYGLTEISCWAFVNDLTNCPLDAEVSFGKPLNDIIYRILENGELEVGSSRRVCFINQERICQVENPVFRKTGDIVRQANKEMYYVSRSNQEVKKYGIKINLSKIENLFINNNELIKECYCIFDKRSSKLGLFYVPATSDASGESYRIKTFTKFSEKYVNPKDDLRSIENPDYIIEMSKTPLNSHNKCDRIKLQYLLGNFKICCSDLQSIFRHLWTETLGIKDSELPSSSFIELGGNSVLALNLVSKLEDQGINIPQSFITALLRGKGYSECLECLEEGKILEKPKFDIHDFDVKFSIKWKFDLGKCVDASPVVFSYKGYEPFYLCNFSLVQYSERLINEKILIGREGRLVVGSHSSKLGCINSDSGEEIWTVLLGDRIESGFTVTSDGTKGYVGCYDHHVYCISTLDGSVIWKFKTGDMVKSTPCLSSDEDIIYVGSYDKKVYCLSASEGQVRNSIELSSGGIFCSGIVGESFKSFFIGTLDGTCAAIHQETNNLIWKSVLSSPVFASPCLIPNRAEILFSEVLGIVHCLNALNGTKVWMFKADGNIYSSPVVDKNTSRIFFGCHDQHLYCLRYEEGFQLIWKQQLDSAIFAKPSIIFEYALVCCATTKGFIYLCSFNSGSIQTRLKLDKEVFSSPVCCNKRLFVGCRDNNVYSLDILNNSLIIT